MSDTKGDYTGNTGFYEQYETYLNESRVREVHDRVFAVVREHESFTRVADLGCGKGKEFFRWGLSKEEQWETSNSDGIRYCYLGLDQNADVGVIRGCHVMSHNYRNVENTAELLNTMNMTAAVSLFSSEITQPHTQNRDFYEDLFAKTGLQTILVSGFYYEHAKGQETVQENGDLTSYQSSAKITDEPSEYFTEARIELPCPSSLFGEDVVEIYTLLQSAETHDPELLKNFLDLTPHGYERNFQREKHAALISPEPF